MFCFRDDRAAHLRDVQALCLLTIMFRLPARSRKEDVPSRCIEAEPFMRTGVAH